MKFKLWNLALVGYFQVSVSGKPSEIEDISQYTIRSRHCQFREKNMHQKWMKNTNSIYFPNVWNYRIVLNGSLVSDWTKFLLLLEKWCSYNKPNCPIAASIIRVSNQHSKIGWQQNRKHIWIDYLIRLCKIIVLTDITNHHSDLSFLIYILFFMHNFTLIKYNTHFSCNIWVVCINR